MTRIRLINTLFELFIHELRVKSNLFTTPQFHNNKPELTYRKKNKNKNIVTKPVII